MSKDQGARRYLDIPGEKTLIYTFKFNMDLPAPVPPPKTMYIPLDPERYIKPKLTLFHVKRKANLLSDINLSIPVDEVNMRPELYNPAPDAKFELTEKDRELLEEKPTVKKEEPSTKTTNGKPQAAGQKDKVATTKAQPSNKAKPDAAQSKKQEAAQAPKKKEEQKKLSIDEYVKKTFETASTYTTGMKHPSKEGLQVQEVFDIVPDFNNLITELYFVKAEVSAETIKSKENIIKFETDLDKKPIVGLYLNAPLGEGASQGMEEEKEDKEKTEALIKRVENFEHFGNYVYSNPKPHGTIKKDLLLNVSKSTGKALIYQPHSLILKKKKVLFMTKTIYKDEDMEEEKKPKEKKRTIKILKRNLDKDELLLKKKKFKELQLENTGMYKKNNKDLDSYKEPEDDELDIVRKRFVVEEEEEEENQGEEEEQKEEEEEVGYEEKASHEERGSQQEEKDDRNEPMEEEAQYNEEQNEAKPAKEGSEDEDAQELAEFFADSDEDDE